MLPDKSDVFVARITVALARVVLKTSNLVISCRCCEESAKICFKIRAARAARLFFLFFSSYTQVIIQNRALSLARYLGLSADNHLDGQNGRQ